MLTSALFKHSRKLRNCTFKGGSTAFTFLVVASAFIATATVSVLVYRDMYGRATLPPHMQEQMF